MLWRAMSRVDIFPPRRERAELDAESELVRLESLATLLDSWFVIPGTGIRVGLDPIVGLVPGVGDAVMFIASLYIVDRLSRLGLSSWTKLRMLGNVVVDLLIGSIPVLGDIFDVGFKANIRNLALARRALGF